MSSNNKYYNVIDEAVSRRDAMETMLGAIGSIFGGKEKSPEHRMKFDMDRQASKTPYDMRVSDMQKRGSRRGTQQLFMTKDQVADRIDIENKLRKKHGFGEIDPEDISKINDYTDKSRPPVPTRQQARSILQKAGFTPPDLPATDTNPLTPDDKKFARKQSMQRALDRINKKRAERNQPPQGLARTPRGGDAGIDKAKSINPLARRILQRLNKNKNRSQTNEGFLDLFQKRRENAMKNLKQKGATGAIMRDNPVKPKLNVPDTGPESRGFGKKDALPKPKEKAFDPRKRYPKDVRGIGPITTSGYRRDIA